MFRIDNASAVSALPAALAAGTPGFFGRGDPATGQIPTILTADWANMVQEELVAVVAAAGIALDKANRAQLLAALQQMFQAKDPATVKIVSASLTQNGHIVLSDGSRSFMVAWGRFTAAANSSTSVTFPLAFTSACFSVVVSGVINAGTGSQDNTPAVVASTITATGFSVFNADDENDPTCYIAVGS
ncbi:hypothetical protein [Novosphingobium sp. KA1]|uniref:gp53-like domain-containing protein n=1 Tax=Novosphingobium sp. (strain KA1) TaxID=164608 RepID=UPI001A8F2330|nr:hypothetical protein [Novosphingobium sp. KA1]QSR16079.1 hypothetical protein CA833_02510 [Novosphingobium sp. KA1]